MEAISSCLLCGSKTKQHLCSSCLNDLGHKLACCPLCGSSTTTETTCGKCLKSKPVYSSTTTLFPYQYPTDKIIHMFKYMNKAGLEKYFVSLMVDVLCKKKCYKPSLIIPIPLHKHRQRERGYNQSMLLASGIGRKLGINVDSKSCKRIIDTPPQSSLSMNDRKKNVLRSFICTNRDLPKHVAIVDDVITTGCTVNEMAKTLRKYGAKRIDVWAIAKT